MTSPPLTFETVNSSSSSVGASETSAAHPVAQGARSIKQMTTRWPTAFVAAPATTVTLTFTLSRTDAPFHTIYDNNGNLLTKVVGTDMTQYAWDFENRLTQVTLPNGTVVNYKYDALGRRIQRTTSGGAYERYVYDGQNVIEDLDSSSSVVTSYLNGPGIDNHLRQTNNSTGVSYFLTDHLGSTSALTDGSGNLLEQISYGSFGNHVGSSRTRYTYTGRERDPDTGLMYNRARFYDPQIGRFISEDPIGLHGGINPYAYVVNYPIGLIDPYGLVQDGPVNYLRDPFSSDHWILNAGSNTISDVLFLDKFAGWAWVAGDWCRPTSERLWAGGKIIGTAALLAGGGQLAKGALGAGASLLGAGAGDETALLGGHLDGALSRLANEGLTPAQEAALADNPGLKAAFEGERLDTFFKESVSTDPALSHLEITGRFKFGPDVYDPATGRWWDVTTPGQWSSHVTKYSGNFGVGTPLFH
jgi:RHS repeat-associated protein